MTAELGAKKKAIILLNPQSHNDTYLKLFLLIHIRIKSSCLMVRIMMKNQRNIQKLACKK